MPNFQEPPQPLPPQPAVAANRERPASLSAVSLENAQSPVVTDPKQLPIYGQHAEPEALRKLPLVSSASGWEPMALAQLAWWGGELLGNRAAWVGGTRSRPITTIAECMVRGTESELAGTDVHRTAFKYVQALRKRVWKLVAVSGEVRAPNGFELTPRAITELNSRAGVAVAAGLTLLYQQLFHLLCK